MRAIAEAVEEVSEELDRGDVEEFVESVLDAGTLFLMGAGRSGLVAKAFAMRLMHLGLNVHVVGEPTTPLHDGDDLVVAISGSGETSSMVDMGKIVSNSRGTELALVTADANSTLAGMSDHVVELDLEGVPSSVDPGQLSGLAPLGTLFEATVFVFLDGVISMLMDRLGQGEDDLERRHAALE